MTSSFNKREGRAKAADMILGLVLLVSVIYCVASATNLFGPAPGISTGLTGALGQNVVHSSADNNSGQR